MVLNLPRRRQGGKLTRQSDARVERPIAHAQAAPPPAPRPARPALSIDKCRCEEDTTREI
ncbi:hypothetical protein JYU34_013709 [Plutella xylostella]|uniref:Uncharacterized protein n=1 Tax=Plutella xylostella TaxID=51655 RepID=A0ABQ7QE40_PLUXY|nr:hypothetical protein JYU34_013709 [Plutella xylostella]